MSFVQHPVTHLPVQSIRLTAVLVESGSTLFWKTRKKSHKTHLKLKHLFHHVFFSVCMSNSQYLSECLFSAACSKWQQLISLFCELETYLLQKTCYEKRASYRPHLIPSQKTFVCASFFSLVFSLLPSPLFFTSFLCVWTEVWPEYWCHGFVQCIWTRRMTFCPLFFSHRTASSYCAWRPLRESRSNYQSRGLSERHTHKQTHTHAKQSATSLFRRSNQDESLKRP